MKKKLLAVVLSVVMIAALIVPMMAISAADAPTATLGLGEPTIKTIKGVDYVVIPVNISNNTSQLFTARYKVISDDDLAIFSFENGDIKDVFEDDFGNPTDIVLNLVKNSEGGKNYAQVVQDANQGDRGISTASGWLGSAYFVAPTEPGTYTFTLEWMDGTDVDTVDGKKVTRDYVMSYNPQKVTYTVECTNHVAGTPEVTKEADCVTAGEKVTKCTACGFEMNKEVIPALGHDWDNGVPAEDVKCGETADTTYTCETCGETKVETGAVVQHDWKLDEEASVAPKCGVAGKNVYKCQRENCPVGTKEEAVAALEHIWELDEEASVAPECEVAGKDVYKCAQENCPVGTKEEAVEALGHDFFGEVVVKKAPTADAEGEYTVACVNGCGEVETRVAKKLAAEVEHSVGDKVLISFKSEENILPEDVMPVSDGGSKDEETGKITEKFTFDSVLVDDLKGEAEFSIDTSVGGEYKNFKVYTNDAQGNPVEVEFTFKNGVLTFNVDLEGEYTLEYEEGKTSPDTSDASNVVVFAVVAFMAVAGLVVVFKKRFAL